MPDCCRSASRKSLKRESTRSSAACRSTVADSNTAIVIRIRLRRMGRVSPAILAGLWAICGADASMCKTVHHDRHAPISRVTTSLFVSFVSLCPRCLSDHLKGGRVRLAPPERHDTERSELEGVAELAASRRPDGARQTVLMPPRPSLATTTRYLPMVLPTHKKTLRMQRSLNVCRAGRCQSGVRRVAKAQIWMSQRVRGARIARRRARSAETDAHPRTGETRRVYEWTGCGCFFAYSLKNSWPRRSISSFVRSSFRVATDQLYPCGSTNAPIRSPQN